LLDIFIDHSNIRLIPVKYTKTRISYFQVYNLGSYTKELKNWNTIYDFIYQYTTSS